jgi:hypothetical protein
MALATKYFVLNTGAKIPAVVSLRPIAQVEL